MAVTFKDMNLFLLICETGSLKQAAETMDVEQSLVSRRLSVVEKHVGTTLIKRSRIGSQMTDAGRAYYSGLKTLLEQMSSLEAEVSGTEDEPKGLLRVSSPIDFGARFVAGWLQQLSMKHPKLAVELVVSDEVTNMDERAIDVALRIGIQRDSALIGRSLGEMPTMAVSSPEYLDRFGDITSWADIQRANFVLYSALETRNMMTFTNVEGKSKTLKLKSMHRANNLQAMASMVLSGAGLHVGPEWYFADYIASGNLVEVLPQWKPPSFPFTALYRRTTFIPAKTTAFLNLAKRECESISGIKRR